MTFMSWFSYLVTSLALVYLLTESTIFVPLRVSVAKTGPIAKSFVYCRACAGFWIGLSMSFVGKAPFDGAVLSGFTVMLLGYLWMKLAPNDAWEVEQALYERTEGES